MFSIVPPWSVTEEPADPQLMEAVLSPTWRLPSCTTICPELAPDSLSNPAPVFKTVPAPVILLAKVIAEGATKLMKEPASGERENAGLVTVPRFTVTVAPLAAPRKEPAPHVMPEAGTSVS